MTFIKHFIYGMIIASSTHVITGGAPTSSPRGYDIPENIVRDYALWRKQTTRDTTQTLFQKMRPQIPCCPGIEHETLIDAQFDRTGPWDEQGNCHKKCCLCLYRKNCTCSSTLSTCSCLTLTCAGASCISGLAAELVASYLYCSVIQSFNAAAPYAAIGGGIAMGGAVIAVPCALCMVADCDCSPISCAKYCDEEIINDLADPTSWGETEKTALKRDLKRYNININDETN